MPPKKLRPSKWRCSVGDEVVGGSAVVFTADVLVDIVVVEVIVALVLLVIGVTVVDLGVVDGVVGGVVGVNVVDWVGLGVVVGVTVEVTLDVVVVDVGMVGFGSEVVVSSFTVEFDKGDVDVCITFVGSAIPSANSSELIVMPSNTQITQVDFILVRIVSKNAKAKLSRIVWKRV